MVESCCCCFWLWSGCFDFSLLHLFDWLWVMGLTVKFVAPFALVRWCPVALVRCQVWTVECAHCARRYFADSHHHRLHLHHLRLDLHHLRLTRLRCTILWLVNLLRLSIERVLLRRTVKLIVHHMLHRLLLVLHRLLLVLHRLLLVLHRLLLRVQRILRLVLHLDPSIWICLDSRYVRHLINLFKTIELIYVLNCHIIEG